MTLSITSQKRRSDVHPAAAQSNKPKAGVLHATTTFAFIITEHSRPTSHLCFKTLTRLSTSRADTAEISQKEQQNCSNSLKPRGEESDTLMAATVEDLYRNYGILADAKEDLSTVNKASYICDVAL